MHLCYGEKYLLVPSLCILYWCDISIFDAFILSKNTISLLTHGWPKRFPQTPFYMFDSPLHNLVVFLCNGFFAIRPPMQAGLLQICSIWSGYIITPISSFLPPYRPTHPPTSQPLFRIIFQKSSRGQQAESQLAL